jgi:hypothetical protein
MNRQLIVSLVAAVASFVVSTVAAQAQVVAPNLPAGTPYRVVFASTGTYQSYNTTTPSQTRSLSYWQNIVNNEAAASSSPTITGATFRLVGSVFDAALGVTVSAPTLTGMSNTVSDGIPVYNTLGQLVATDSVSFWSATHLAAMNTDRNGGTLAAGAVWTGWTPQANNRMFGSSLATFIGNSGQTTWNPVATLGSTSFLRIYAISEPISTIPTPGAAALLGLGGLAMARRRR